MYAHENRAIEGVARNKINLGNGFFHDTLHRKQKKSVPLPNFFTFIHTRMASEGVIKIKTYEK